MSTTLHNYIVKHLGLCAGYLREGRTERALRHLSAALPLIRFLPHDVGERAAKLAEGLALVGMEAESGAESAKIALALC